MAKNPAAKPNPAKIADQQAEAFRLKLAGYSVRGIAAEMGMATTTVQDRLTAAYGELVHPLAAEARDIELARLDACLIKATEVLNATHVTVSHGRLIQDTDGNPVPDYDMPLKAIDRLTRLSESRRKLLGIDAPERVEQTTTLLPPADPAVAALLDRGRQELGG